jgi:hypothetical protein
LELPLGIRTAMTMAVTTAMANPSTLAATMLGRVLVLPMSSVWVMRGSERQRGPQ